MRDFDPTIDDSPGDGPYDQLREHYGPMINTQQVADLFGVHTKTVLDWVHDGRLPATKINPDNRKYHFLLDEVIAILEQNRTTN